MTNIMEMSAEMLERECEKINRKVQRKRQEVREMAMSLEEQAGMNGVTGTCKYCSQMRTVWVKDPAEYSQDDIDKIASSECSCPGAEKESKKNQLMSSGKDAIRMTLEERHRKNAAKIMEAGLESVCSGRIKKITVQIDSETTATMLLAKAKNDTRVIVECRTTVTEWSDGEQDE